MLCTAKTTDIYSLPREHFLRYEFSSRGEIVCGELSGTELIFCIPMGQTQGSVSLYPAPSTSHEQSKSNLEILIRLRTVAELCREIVDREAGEDVLSSCTAEEALERREPFINDTIQVEGACSTGHHWATRGGGSQTRFER
jgi:hypothetical protein